MGAQMAHERSKSKAAQRRYEQLSLEPEMCFLCNDTSKLWHTEHPSKYSQCQNEQECITSFIKNHNGNLLEKHLIAGFHGRQDLLQVVTELRKQKTSSSSLREKYETIQALEMFDGNWRQSNCDYLRQVREQYRLSPYGLR